MSVEAASRPTFLWMFSANSQRTRITDLNPQLAHFTFSQPELSYFDNADGDHRNSFATGNGGDRDSRNIEKGHARVGGSPLEFP